MTSLFFRRCAGRSPKSADPAMLSLQLGTALLAGVLLLGLLCPGAADAQEDAALFPDLSLQGQLEPEMVEQLGISGTPFRLSDIPKPFLFVEIFSMYCPYCQRDAPEVNRIFEEVRSSNLWEELRFVGIGTGNTQYEVDVYAEQFQTRFPLLPDNDFTMHSALGNVGTPYYLLLRNAGPGKLEVIHSVEGAPDNMDAMFATMLRKAGLQ